MRNVEQLDALLIAGVLLVAAGAGAVCWAAFGPLVAAGVGAGILGVCAIAASILLDAEQAARTREAAARGETPDVPGRDR